MKAIFTESASDGNVADQNLTNERLVELVEIMKRDSASKKLNLNSNPQLTDISPLRLLTNLEELSIADTSVVDLSPLSNLRNLKKFNAQDTKVSDISALKNSTGLQVLILTSTKVDNRVIEIVGDFCCLTTLSLSDTKVCGDISRLAKCTTLQSLSLVDIDISAFSLLQLTALTRLDSVAVNQDHKRAKHDLMQKISCLRTESGLDSRQKTLIAITSSQPLANAGVNKKLRSSLTKSSLSDCGEVKPYDPSADKFSPYPSQNGVK